MRLPQPRGPISAELVDVLGQAPAEFPDFAIAFDFDDVVHNGDLQLALFICYELHYRGFDGVDDRWEWQPSIIRLRNILEQQFDSGVARLIDRPSPVAAAEIPHALAELVSRDDADGPSLADFMQHEASLEQFKEFLIQRSIYQLKEADHHTWAIPRLEGKAKAALIEIQIDEYGQGQVGRLHADLFRTTLSCLDLDTQYGAYIDAVPAVSLAMDNLATMFGLHRRLCGCLLGHLAAYEMTSSLPNRRYSNALQQLGGDARATRFFDEHVEADAVHEQVASHDMCASFVAEQPDTAIDVLFGAAACLKVQRLVGEHLLRHWTSGETALRSAPYLAPTSI